jgi:hypothetical protein
MGMALRPCFGYVHDNDPRRWYGYRLFVIFPFQFFSLVLRCGVAAVTWQNCTSGTTHHFWQLTKPNDTLRHPFCSNHCIGPKQQKCLG